MRAVPAIMLLLALAGCGDRRLPVTDAGEDARVNHPVDVTPQVTKLEVPSDGRGHIDLDQGRAEQFMTEFARDGHGPIRVSGTSSDVAAALRQLFRAGARADDVRPVPGGALELSFRGYVARLEDCQAGFGPTLAGSRNPLNIVQPDYGCVTQRNMAAMVDDPSDLARRRGWEGGVNPHQSDPQAGDVADYRTYAKPSTTSTQPSSGSASK